jgi:Tol biopolymer transport system component
MLAALVLALLPGGIAGASHPAKQSSGHIAYVGSDGNVYVVQPDGTGKSALTADGTRDTPYALPQWSPNGTGILALRYVEGLQAFKKMATAGLYLISPTGGSRQLVSNVPRGFAWAPDGHTAVYETGYPPDRTTIVQVDTRANTKRAVYCDSAFTLLAVADNGARAIGTQQGEIAAVALQTTTTQTVVPTQLLTHYGAKAGLWRNEVVIGRSSHTALYSIVPGTQVVSLNLRTGHSSTTRLSDPLEGFAPSPDGHWLAYSTGIGAAVQAKVLRLGKGTLTALRALSSVTPQAFAPDSSSLAFTARDAGQPYVFAAPLTCLTHCMRRLSTGSDAAWGP